MNGAKKKITKKEKLKMVPNIEVMFGYDDKLKQIKIQKSEREIKLQELGSKLNDIED